MAGSKVATIVLAVTLVVSSAAMAMAQDSSAGSDLAVFDATLTASGVDDAVERHRLELAFLEMVSEFRREIGGTRSAFHRAQRLHEALHARVLRRYRASADGIHAILDRGEYNCVSATLLYGMLARAVGLDVKVIASPRHVHLRLYARGREIDVECTSPEGFDVRHDLTSFARFVIAYKLADREEVEARGAKAIFDEFHELAMPVSLERAVAFVWHNTGQRALDGGEPMRAARALYEEYRIDPGMARSSESLPWCLARAFRIEYEAGRFDNAYEIAAMDFEIFPGRTTPRDRLLAAAVKRVENASTRGDASEAERILDDARALVAAAGDVARIEREVCPRIAATAVRAGDWSLAERMVLRFLLVEPDAVESAQLAAWVKDRREASAGSLQRPTAALGAIDPALAHLSSLLYSSSPFPLAGPAAPLRGQRVPPGDLFHLREGTRVHDTSGRR